MAAPAAGGGCRDAANCALRWRQLFRACPGLTACRPSPPVKGWPRGNDG